MARLRSLTLQMPLPWVFDWAALRSVDAEAADAAVDAVPPLGQQPLEMRWLSGDSLFTVLQDAAPTGVRDADPAYWLLRLDALRLANRPDQFDEAAIDYCVTYEVSPPSWERARCSVRISGSALSTRIRRRCRWSARCRPASSNRAGRRRRQRHAGGQRSSCRASWSATSARTLDQLNAQLGTSPMVNGVVRQADPRRLHRRRRPAQLGAGQAQREPHACNFVDAHRLVALFFGAMGINEHAKVQVRKV